MSKRKQLMAALERQVGASEAVRRALADFEACSHEVISLLDEAPPKPVAKVEPKKLPPADKPNGEAEEMFWRFHENYPGTKRSARTEFELLKRKHRDYVEVCYKLPDLLSAHISWRKKQTDFVAPWQHMQTFLNQRSWEIAEVTKAPSVSKGPAPAWRT